MNKGAQAKELASQELCNIIIESWETGNEQLGHGRKRPAAAGIQLQLPLDLSRLQILRQGRICSCFDSRVRVL